MNVPIETLLHLHELACETPDLSFEVGDTLDNEDIALLKRWTDLVLMAWEATNLPRYRGMWPKESL